ncbi:MAG: STAS domain-containing protein [Pseudomonadota bacterium]
MGVKAQLSNDSRQVTMHVDGRFDFQVHDEFRNAYCDVSPGGVKFTVDLCAAEYMDSSALGMLLLLKEHAGDAGKVEIVNSQSDVLNVLKIANFDKLFEIH